MAHRYWRLTCVSVNGGGALELSEARLYAAGSAVDAASTLTCPIAPMTGALTHLKDGLSTDVVSWSPSAYQSSGFSLVWDLGGAGSDVDALQLGGVARNTFLRDVIVQYSDDAVTWATFVNLRNLGYSAGLAMLPLDTQYPSVLFASGERGVWYDPSDMATLFQDAAGTIPVTAIGQPVGKVLDKSGNGNHATQSIAVRRPILRQDANGVNYLYFAGSSLATASTRLSAADKLSVFSAVQQEAQPVAIVWESSPNINTNTGAFYMTASEVVAGDWTFRNRGNNPTDKSQVGGSIVPTSPEVHRISMALDIAGTTAATEVAVRLNGSSVALSHINGTLIPDSGSGNYGQYPLYIGARAGTSLFFTGRIYGLVIRGIASTAPEFSRVENWLLSKLDKCFDLNPSAQVRTVAVKPERLLPAVDLPPTTAHGHLREFPFFDVFNGGIGLITGTVKEKSLPANVPLARKVWLMDEASGMVIRETWSDATTGNYEFRGVKQGVKYTVLAYDYTHTYRAVVADNLETT